MKNILATLKKTNPLVVLFAVITVALGIYNVGKEKFFELNLYNCLYLLVVLFISYYLTQSRNDVRKRKDVQIAVIESLLKTISQAYEIKITTQEDTQWLLASKRDLSNKIALICDEENGFNLVTADIEFLKDKENEYDQIIGNHISDVEHLNKARSEIHRPLVLLEQRLYKIMLAVYK